MLKIPRVSEWSVSQFFEIEDIDKTKGNKSIEGEVLKAGFTKERTLTGEKEKKSIPTEIYNSKIFYNEKGDFGSSVATTQIYNSGKSSVQTGFMEESTKSKNKRLSSFGNKVGELDCLRGEKSRMNERIVE